jgi:hypothetical protein
MARHTSWMRTEGTGYPHAADVARDRAARFSERTAACRAAARIRELDGVPRRAVRLTNDDGWPTLAVPAAVVERHADIHSVIWTEGGLPDWPQPRDPEG